MAAIIEDGKLRLTGYVGDYYFEDGFTSQDVVLALAGIDDDDPLDVHLNSGGGIASEGAAIHALLTSRRGETNIIVEGIAASAASLIAMAGGTVTMSAGAVMMIHDPAGGTFGNSADHSKTIEALEALATAYSRVYAAKSGKTAEECREIMKAERWLTPDEAVKEGFADETTEQKAKPVAAFDYRLFAHAPKNLVAMAKKKNWSLPATMAAPAAQHRPTEEISMTDKERADQLAAENNKLKADLDAANGGIEAAVKSDRDRRTAIMALEEAKGREALAEHLFTQGSTVDQAKATLTVSPKASADDNNADDYRPRRTTMNGSGLNKQDGTGQQKGDRSLLSASVDRANKRR
ncbi:MULTISPECIES: head maturation protease, ClpP-related [unclassified Rhizobium]|uniref:head maturation protease, ClpP-related n=1 Tax=unclassified Rhizobium TaxID=2613769 RepID=UPI001ADAA568|nr:MULTISPECIES: head maturation protease, ClpP-related [unclassified Rhizobium]MBO9125467.1 Clp protease ClpP [Rhizobium sp. 16-488-2b]MBO9176052.1 Clp protease ClpP [Rhizobium sp. 16-488-2a]